MAGNTNTGSKVYACPADREGAQQTYPVPPGYIKFQEDYRANAYIFRQNAGASKLSALRATGIPTPAAILMITEKEWNSPSFQTTSTELKAWLDGWNGNSGKNYGNSGFERHNKVRPVVVIEIDRRHRRGAKARGEKLRRKECPVANTSGR